MERMEDEKLAKRAYASTDLPDNPTVDTNIHPFLVLHVCYTVTKQRPNYCMKVH